MCKFFFCLITTIRLLIFYSSHIHHKKMSGWCNIYSPLSVTWLLTIFCINLNQSSSFHFRVVVIILPSSMFLCSCIWNISLQEMFIRWNEQRTCRKNYHLKMPSFCTKLSLANGLSALVSSVHWTFFTTPHKQIVFIDPTFVLHIHSSFTITILKFSTSKKVRQLNKKELFIK